MKQNPSYSFCIIDDDNVFIHTSKLLVRSVFGDNTEIDGFSDPEEGIAKVVTQKYDVLLLDILMDPIDGWEVLKRLEKKNCLPKHVYILSSGLKIEDIEYVATLPHVNAFIKKPLTKDRLERIQFSLQ